MSAAQDEINGLLARNTDKPVARHPEDEDQLHYSDEAPEDDSDNHRHRHRNHKQKQDYDHDQDSDGSGIEQEAMPSSTRGYTVTVPVKHFSANTGPKGVIADAQSFEKAKHSSWRSRLRSNISRHTSSHDHFAKELVKTPPRGSLERGDLSSEDDDEEFMREWRKHRLRELQTYDPRARRQSPSKRKYGRVEVVDASGYLDAVEKVGSETVVVVAIYDDESPVSRLVEDCLNTLAQKYSETRFVKLHYIEAEMDIASVPAILGYKGGDLFANLVSVIDQIPPNRNLSSSSLELVLRQ
ncbi:hypothetical protein FGG08_000232 [Glutinoglossum americanum]|uniref:Phosducin domain-containing protein n=1 Tax=Glutinoglossum americanum TaxID=1670608 RepID=A0A9P8IDL0_9PEZI|nr:hypothetical protein FGG08_000232 [Glutinoglossum americanum]